ncbi:MAG: hypothetical protein LBE13_14030 [Bacteroidales bacterium]|nr:hypothetical protein [Bacteroidales bacterium]
MKVFNSVENNLLFALLDAGNEENGFYTWTWLCKTNAILVTIKTVNIDVFLSRNKTKNFLGILVNQQIAVRDFEFNKIFKNVEKIENFEDGIERYIIDGSTDRQEWNKNL